MKNKWMVPGMKWGMGLAVALTCAALAGCDDGGDDDGAEAATGVVTTNEVTGAVTTNGVTDADGVAPIVEGPVNAAVGGYWNGVFESDEGTGHLELDLDESGDAVTGQFNLSSGGVNQVGNVAGSIEGDHLTLLMLVPGSDAWIELDGYVNANVESYIGTWSGTFGSGDFALQK